MKETVTGLKINPTIRCPQKKSSLNIKKRNGERYTILVGLKVNIQKTKIMASGPITSWEIDGETVETVSRLYFWGLQNHCRW